MKRLSCLLAIIGILVVLGAVIGRYVDDNTVTVFGIFPRMKAATVLLIGNTFFLMAIISRLWSRE